MPAVPYKDTTKSKKHQVMQMFDNISKRYDFLNHFLSMGIDTVWRRKTIAMLGKERPNHALDIATGTGDLALELMRLEPRKVTGIDISQGMLEIGRRKIRKKKFDKIIHLELGDSENLKFPDNEFDVVTVAFGVRNFENLEKGLEEMYRVTKKGGKVVILEFSKPKKAPFKQIYNFYLFNILPLMGKMISKHNTAYSYLPKSVGEFPSGQEFLKKLSKSGFKSTLCKPLTFGISSIYVGEK